MSSFKLTTSGDLDLSTGTLQWVTGGDAIAQNARTRLRFFKREWFLDLRKGVPYYERILGQKNAVADMTAILRQVVLETPGIASIDRMDVSFDGATRVASVRVRARTTGAEVVDFDHEVMVS